MNQEALNMAKSEKTEVSVAGSTAVATVASFEEDAAVGGFGDMGADDLALPFLKILTNMSPQIGSVDGATPGMLFNSVTGELYDGKKGVVVVPCSYVRQYVEWAPRGSGSGAPVAIHPATSDILTKTHREAGDSKDYLENGNYVENTANHYVMLVDKEGGYSHALISMKSTQLKKSRKWNSMMMSVKLDGKNGKFTPPMYSQKYRLTVVQEQKDQYKWHGWEIERVGTIEDQYLYGAAKSFAESISAGDVNVKHENEDSSSSSSDHDVF
jgi:hypothetical protein